MATSTTDYITGLYAAFGAMLALEVRHRTGKGPVGQHAREAFAEARRRWERLGRKLTIGVGIASGYATLGLVGDAAEASGSSQCRT